MRAHAADGRPGSFAQKRFVDRRRAWRRRFFWAFPVVIVIPLAVVLPLLMVTGGHGAGFLVGLACGAGIGAGLVSTTRRPPTSRTGASAPTARRQPRASSVRSSGRGGLCSMTSTPATATLTTFSSAHLASCSSRPNGSTGEYGSKAACSRFGGTKTQTMARRTNALPAGPGARRPSCAANSPSSVSTSGSRQLLFSGRTSSSDRSRAQTSDGSRATSSAHDLRPDRGGTTTRLWFE
jgi:hypothetical protein